VELTGNAEIAELQDAGLSYENVLRFNIAVQNVFVEHSHDRHDHVREVSQNLFRCESSPCCNFLLDCVVEVAEAGIFHYDVDLFVVSERFVKAHDCRPF
jgi:hypothetical protein